MYSSLNMAGADQNKKGADASIQTDETPENVNEPEPDVPTDPVLPEDATPEQILEFLMKNSSSTDDRISQLCAQGRPRVPDMNFSVITYETLDLSRVSGHPREGNQEMIGC